MESEKGPASAAPASGEEGACVADTSRCPQRNGSWTCSLREGHPGKHWGHITVTWDAAPKCPLDGKTDAQHDYSGEFGQHVVTHARSAEERGTRDFRPPTPGRIEGER